MGINLTVDDELLSEAKKFLGEESSDKVVSLVLERFCQARRKNQDILDIAGTVEFYEDYDPKTLRFSRYDPD